MGFDTTKKHLTGTTVLGPIELGKYALIQDQKANGTGGGTFTSGARRTRDLNTIVVDQIGITLNSNQFILPAGTYIITARAPGNSVASHQAWLRNITEGEDTLTGSTAGCATTVLNHHDSNIMGQFTITASTTFEIQHECSATLAANGFGRALLFSGTIEVFTQVVLLKVA